jgi:hypothetical protein
VTSTDATMLPDRQRDEVAKCENVSCRRRLPVSVYIVSDENSERELRLCADCGDERARLEAAEGGGAHSNTARSVSVPRQGFSVAGVGGERAGVR